MIGKFFEEVVSLIPELFKKEESWLLIFILLIGGFVSFSLFQFVLSPSDILTLLLNFLKATWWFWLFFILLWPFQGTLLFLKQEKDKQGLEFVLVEIKIPREVQKSPKSMEQILLICHSFPIFSLEIVTMGGQIHLYVRCLKKQKDILESSFFSYYPDVELAEVPDYAGTFPQTPKELYMSGMDIWSSEMLLAREEMIPIKTYTQFEMSSEDKRVDPLSVFLEVLGKAKKNETFCIQILTRPADSKWGDAWKDDLEKLREKVKGGTPDSQTGAATTPEPQKFETLKAIENNITKPAFKTTIRLFYVAPKDQFSPSFLQSGIVSAFNQYSALSLNAFKKNSDTITEKDSLHSSFFFPGIRVELRKQRALLNYVRRDPPQEIWMAKFLTSHFFNWNFASKSFVLNVEGVATIFHLPTSIVLTAPHIERMESRKAGPTAGLPIFGDESDIERFY